METGSFDYILREGHDGYVVMHRILYQDLPEPEAW